MKNAIYSKFRIIIAMAMLVVHVFVSSNTVAANKPDTDEPRIIRVGYSGYGSSREQKDRATQNTIAPYNQAYLDYVARLNNWQFAYVYGTPQQCMERLTKGQIDLLGPVQSTLDLRNTYAYPDLEFGHEYAVLYCSRNSDTYYFEDFKAFNGMKVGLLAGNTNNRSFTAYAASHGFDFNSQYFNTPADLIDALEAGSIDAYVGSKFAGTDTVKAIGLFAFEPYYYITTKGNNDVLDGLNRALSYIHTHDPGFETRVENEYFPQGILAYDMQLTRNEVNFHEKNPVLGVSTFSSWTNVSELNEETSNFTGIVPDILAEIESYTKLRFLHVPGWSDSEPTTALDTGQAMVSVVVDGTYDKNKYKATDPFIEIPLLLVGLSAAPLTPDLRVALPFTSDYGDVHSVIGNEYSIVDCVDAKDCLDALRNKEADMAVLDQYSLDRINKENNYGGLYINGEIDYKVRLRLAVSSDSDPSLLTMLGKGVGKLTPDTIRTIELRHTTQQVYKVGFARVINDYLYYFIGAVAVVLLLLVGVYVSHKYSLNRKLKSVAYTDTLLGISNFEKFKLDAVSLFQKFRREDFSMIYFDINRFKYINDNFGYKTGNDVLNHVARCAKDILYEYELFTRVSADNFVMLLKNTEERLIIEMTKKLSRAVQDNSVLSDAGHRVTLCFGIYRLSQEKEDIYTIMDRANAARKDYKGSHETTYAFYDDKMLRKLANEVKLTEAMRPALERGEFKLFLQPKHDAKDGRIVGAEALVRWMSDSMGIIQPNSFIPLMEKNGFITKIDFYIFEAVCKMISDMRNKSMVIFPISVNLSRVHLESRNFIHTLNDIAQRYEIPPGIIELELTESMIMQNQREVLIIMHALREIGFPLSLDDFGTGFSSLNLLMEMPINVLKLDKSFLNEAIDAQREKTIIRDIIQMAHHLNIQIVCEGVETTEQFELLRELECDIVQGYLFSRPIPWEEYYNYIKKHTLDN